ncbi:glycosyltransferase [Tautonia sociabilis]|uniref:Glycosyltransferase n=1 Tax=Tautonia sociabilis TaxID=2080755 RepID=A0A432MFF0_9BACT|nr:glycosyltransferase family 4 protein [Tautonia sociabilis]RUL84931.1 glycosyltransferase [Tautonia sociabilis]
MDRPRILLIVPVLPWPAHDFGGAQRTALLLEGLEAIGQVELMWIRPAEGLLPPAGVEALRDRFRIVSRFEVGSPRPAGFWRLPGRMGLGPARRLAALDGQYEADGQARTWLKEQVDRRRYDLIACRYLRTAMLAGADRMPAVPRVLDLDDLDWQILASRIRTVPEEAGRARAGVPPTVRYHRATCRRRAMRFNWCWVASRDDLSEAALPRSSVLPNVPFRPPGSPPISPCAHRPESREVLYVGRLDYPPNREGLGRFIGSCWPRIRAEVPEATLRIVGDGLDEETRARWSAEPGVVVAGFLADLREAYERCALAIAPVDWGGGTKIKVIEALAFGRTCVATPHALHGYEHLLRHGEAIWRGASDEQEVRGCIALLTDPAMRERMADVGRRLVSEHYSADAIREEVAATCDRLLSRASRRRAGSPSPSPAVPEALEAGGGAG